LTFWIMIVSDGHAYHWITIFDPSTCMGMCRWASEPLIISLKSINPPSNTSFPSQMCGLGVAFPDRSCANSLNSFLVLIYVSLAWDKGFSSIIA
jgi:hypothetical protein